MNCEQCDAEVPEVITRVCWQDPHTLDHRGLCCSCFDVSLGARPPVIMNLRTPVSWYRPEDDIEIK